MCKENKELNLEQGLGKESFITEIHSDENQIQSKNYKSGEEEKNQLDKPANKKIDYLNDGIIFDDITSIKYDLSSENYILAFKVRWLKDVRRMRSNTKIKRYKKKELLRKCASQKEFVKKVRNIVYSLEDNRVEESAITNEHLELKTRYLEKIMSDGENKEYRFVQKVEEIPMEKEIEENKNSINYLKESSDIVKLVEKEIEENKDSINYLKEGILYEDILSFDTDLDSRNYILIFKGRNICDIHDESDPKKKKELSTKLASQLVFVKKVDENLYTDNEV